MTHPSQAYPGDRVPDLTFGPVTRAMLAVFAGASGDHNPVHIDSDFARASGSEDVFAQGMLPMGVLTRLITSWAGHAALRGIEVRFAAKTPVGATLTCTGEITERRRTADGLLHLSLDLEGRLENGTVALRGGARVELAQ